MASILSTAIKILDKSESLSITHKSLVQQVCDITGYSYESVRGSLIKRNGGLLDLEGWKYLDGEFFKCDSKEQEGLVVNYQAIPKLDNWLFVKQFLPKKITSMVTLGGEYGNCISCFNPKTVISYDYSAKVLAALSSRFKNVTTELGDIFSHKDPAQVANIDLVGYLSGSLHKNLDGINNRKQYQYIVLTIQGQKFLRNHGKFVDWAKERYKGLDDPTLKIITDVLSSYEIKGWQFYKRHARARRMRTLVFKLK